MDKRILIYTFRAFPHINRLAEEFSEVFIFGPLKTDWEKFVAKVHSIEPDWIIGVANSKRSTRWEPLAINRFNRGEITRLGKKEYALTVPPGIAASQIAKRPSHTFCNWSMYRIAELQERERLKFQLSFMHVRSADLERLISRVQAA